MTILNIISSLSWGGMERDHFYLATELAGMGHSVHTAYLLEGTSTNKTAQELMQNHIVLHRLRAANNHDPALLFQLVKLIRRTKPDVIHTWQLQMDILGWIAARITRTPCIMMEPSCARGHPNTPKERLRLRVGASFNGIVSNSAGGDDYWRTHCFGCIRYIILNGYPLEEITKVTPAAPADIGLPAGEKYLLYAGRLVPGKGLENLMKAFTLISAELPVYLVFCGEGPLRQSLEKQAGQAGITNRIRFTGFIPNARIWALMKSAYAFVFPSEFEGRPNVVVEAMACGCPLIVSDIPAHREFLNDSTALFTDPYDPVKIADSIRTSWEEPSKNQARTEAALNKVQEYSLSGMAKAYERVYRDILNRRAKNEIRILCISSSLSKGGVERQMFYLTSELARMGHSVHLAYVYRGPSGSLAAQKLTRNRVVLHRLHASNTHDPMLIWQLVKLIHQTKPDIIHTRQLQMDILGWVAARITRTPCIMREPSSARGHPNTLKERLRLRLGATFNAIVSNSAGGDDYWRTHCFGCIRYIILNGYPLEEITKVTPAAPADIGLPAGEKYLLYAGRLVPGKGLENLMKAFTLISAELPVYLVFCGEGPLRQSLEKQAGQAGITNRIRFTGFIPNARIWALMKSAYAFVFPSEFEGRPNVVVEAMACGCPLIVSDIPAHREFLNDSTALFTDPYDPVKIADSIRTSWEEPSKNQARTEAALNKVQEYSLSGMAKAYERVYRDILNRKKGGAR